ncbi:MAG TPA: efflux RND transporter periplasmic adaptor subunit [Candidatus Sulfotelmatobacter sp.]|nr:efflux RND transporter periplasmic adaptor subunit [Candidatus Sulfotelmatobacter sp.]
MRTSRTIVVAGLVVAVAAVGGYLLLEGVERGSGAHVADAAPQGGPHAFVMPVPVTAVVSKTVPVYLDYVGTTEALRAVTLQAKVTGYLLERGAADGADVQQGDLLYRINPRDYQVALEQAKAQAQRDAAALDYSRASQHRNAQLTKDGYASKDTFDQTTSAMRQAQANLAADQAAIQAAELNIGYTEIRAPFAGRLGRSLVHEGTLISAAGTQLNTLVELDPIYVTFNPSETDLAQIEKQRAAGAIAADVMLSGDKAPSFHGTLTFLDNVVDRTTGTIVARATIGNPAHALIPGQYVRVRLHIGDQPNALLVPQAAIGSNQIGKYVYTVGGDGKVEQHYVTLGTVEGLLVVVVSGLKPGDSVIVGNLQKIGPGMPVKPTPAPSTS